MSTVGTAHRDHRDSQRYSTPITIANLPEQQRAQRPHQESRGKDAERVDQRRRLAVRREKVLADRIREESVNREVVPLEDVAGHAGDCQPPLRRSHPLFPHRHPPAPLTLFRFSAEPINPRLIDHERARATKPSVARRHHVIPVRLAVGPFELERRTDKLLVGQRECDMGPLAGSRSMTPWP